MCGTYTRIYRYTRFTNIIIAIYDNNSNTEKHVLSSNNKDVTTNLIVYNIWNIHIFILIIELDF